MKKIIQLAYAAGIIDGEGSFYIGCNKSLNNKFNSRVYVVNTDIRLIQWLKQTFGGLTYSRKSIKNQNWKTKYEWILEKSRIDEFCHKILPYLIIKKQHAEIMIKFRKTFRKQSRPVPQDILTTRFECLQNLKKLNHRGPFLF